MKLLLTLIALPLLAQQPMRVFTAGKERALGEAMASDIRAQSKPFREPSVESYVNRIGTELTAQLQDQGLGYRFEMISGGGWTEPFSLPGGIILIPAQALAAARDEARFAGQIAHAIGHSVLRHTTAAASKTNLATVPLIMLCASSNLLIPTGLRETQRTFEREASRFGADLAARAGFDAPRQGDEYERVRQTVRSLLPAPPQRRVPTLKRAAEK